MRRSAILSAPVAVAAVLAVATPAAAINTYNSEPAPERTEVGAFVALWDTDDDAVVDRLDWVCSGAMVDDDTFLTAAHCTDDWPAGTRSSCRWSRTSRHRSTTPSPRGSRRQRPPPNCSSLVSSSKPTPIRTRPSRARHRTPTTSVARLRDASDHTGRRVELHAGHAADGRAVGHDRSRRAVGLQLARRRVRHRGGAARARWSHPSRRWHPPQGGRGLHRAEHVAGPARHARAPRLRRGVLRRLRRAELHRDRWPARAGRDDHHRGHAVLRHETWPTARTPLPRARSSPRTSTCPDRRRAVSRSSSRRASRRRRRWSAR